jgi:hypothetical protein
VIAPSPRCAMPAPKLLSCEAGESIKPGVQTPGSFWWLGFRAREAAESAVARLAGSNQFLCF